MAQADSVHSTPPTNAPTEATLEQAIDAFSASAAIRLRYTILTAKAVASLPPPILPPPVEIPSHPQHPFYDGTQRAYDDRHPLAHLMRLRDAAAAEIERLLAFLDATDGLDDVELNGDELEPSLTGYSDGMDDREGDQCEDEGAQCDDEGYQESGIGDFDGYMEQCPALFAHCDMRVDP